VGDLKTTQERRDRFRTWLHDEARDHLSIRAWCVAEDACHDVDTLLAESEILRSTMGGLIACNDTLLAENAKLRAVAEAAREYRAMEAPGLTTCCDVARDALDAALAALEAP
jgi:hypothetical protein